MQLHKRDVVAKATEILDNYGIADLTMRRLARELDVSPGALYWHFANKQELLGAVADEVLAPAVAATGPDGWRERITDLAAGCATRCCPTPTAQNWCRPASPRVSRRPCAGWSRLCGAAADAGLVAGQAELAARTVVYYVLGFTADEQSRLQWDAAGVKLADGQSVLRDGNDPDAAFRFGLTVLIRGLNVQGAAVQSHAETNVSAQEFE